MCVCVCQCQCVCLVLMSVLVLLVFLLVSVLSACVSVSFGICPGRVLFSVLQHSEDFSLQHINLKRDNGAVAPELKRVNRACCAQSTD